MDHHEVTHVGRRPRRLRRNIHTHPQSARGKRSGKARTATATERTAEAERVLKASNSNPAPEKHETISTQEYRQIVVQEWIQGE